MEKLFEPSHLPVKTVELESVLNLSDKNKEKEKETTVDDAKEVLKKNDSKLDTVFA